MALKRGTGPGFGRDLLRSTLVLLLLPYAIEKVLPIQFRDAVDLDGRLVGSLNGMDSIWAFFGHSRAYQIGVGMVQGLACVLFSFRRTARIGACLYLAVLANVVLVDLTFRVQTAMWVSAVSMATGCVAWILLESDAFCDALRRLCAPEPSPDVRRALLTWGGAALVFLAFHQMSRFMFR